MRVRVLFNLDDYPNPFLARFVPNISDALNLLLLYKLSYALQHPGLLDLIGNRVDD